MTFFMGIVVLYYLFILFRSSCIDYFVTAVPSAFNWYLLIEV